MNVPATSSLGGGRVWRSARCALRRLRSSRRRSVSVVWTRLVVVTQRPCWAASGSASASPISR